MTKKETEALKKMELALKGLDRVGISLCGMDGGLYYATKLANSQMINVTKIQGAGKIYIS